MSEALHTEFAPAERVSAAELDREVSLALESPIIRHILMLTGGMIVILNKQRQIVAISQGVKDFLSISVESDVFGKRPGEAINCAYADAMPGGCGTSKFCATCGAVNAVLESQRTGQQAEKRCPLRLKPAKEGGEAIDIVLNVRAVPITVGQDVLTMVFLSDITELENKSKLESVFYHDALNSLGGIIASYRLVQSDAHDNERQMYMDMINLLANQLVKDIKVQRILSKNSAGESVQLEMRPIALGTLFEQMRLYVEAKNDGTGVGLEIAEALRNTTINTDQNLLGRVLINMLLNASEASDSGDRVRLWASLSLDGNLRINVWNRKGIPPQDARRVFQRFYSTKSGGGRGIGTHSMKYIGETLLGGKVFFDSSEDEGTTFTVELPLSATTF